LFLCASCDNQRHRAELASVESLHPTMEMKLFATTTASLTATVSSLVTTRNGTRLATSDDDTSQNTRHSGPCSRCFRVLSLTSAGLLHSHGPGCSGSGQMPVDGSNTSVVVPSNPAVQATASEVSVRPFDQIAIVIMDE
jgi:hypothetical protein